VTPFLLAAALGLLPTPTYEGPAAPSPATATRAVAYRLRVLSLANDLPAGVTLNSGATPLTDAQVRAIVRAAEADPTGGILAAPTVTAAEGETASVFTGHTRTFTTGIEAGMKDGQVVIAPKVTTVEVGLRLEFTGQVVAGGKAVTTRFKYVDTRIPATTPTVSVVIPPHGATAGPTTVQLQTPTVDTATLETTAVLSAGGHVVIAGPVRTQEVRTEYGPPVLSRLPYLSRLFTNVGYTRVPVRTYLLLSAVVLEDESATPVAPAPRAVQP
jgi:type II secretory pathway component GspD/PulD (secretin)